MCIGVASQCKINSNIGNSARDFEHRRRTEEAAHLGALRRRHGDGSVDRRRHPRDPRGDHRHSPVPIGTVPIYEAHFAGEAH